MEPISLILAALAAGAVAAAKDTAGTAVKDAYESLKALIKKKFAEKGGSSRFCVGVRRIGIIFQKYSLQSLA